MHPAATARKLAECVGEAGGQAGQIIEGKQVAIVGGNHLEHENAKAELKGLMPEDAKEAIGHGIRAKRSKSGAVSFDVLSTEGSCPRQGPG
jgi:hypothetical protein